MGERIRETEVYDLKHVLDGATITIDDRPVRLRLITPEDTDLWTEFVNECSSRSLWFRFLAPFTATPERARRFCDVDPAEELAVAAEMSGEDHRKLIGIARLVKDPLHGDAEYAVIISDPWQKKALGRLLTERCVDLAKHWGVKAINSQTVRENFPMTRVLQHCRFRIETKDGNMILMSLKLV